MSAEVVAAPERQWRQTLLAYGAWVLVGGCVVLLGTIAVAGERTTSYDELVAAVVTGRVHEVRLDATGQVHWRAGLVDRVADGPRGAARELRRVHPDLRITHADAPPTYAEIGRWRLPAWSGPLGIAVAVGVLALLVAGPQPWRATRWAWFWLLVFAMPLAMLAFLLLGGATRRWRPRRPDRRLTGGPAFLLAVGAQLALASLWR